jgi:hypothetical protein
VSDNFISRQRQISIDGNSDIEKVLSDRFTQTYRRGKEKLIPDYYVNPQVSNRDYSSQQQAGTNNTLSSRGCMLSEEDNESRVGLPKQPIKLTMPQESSQTNKIQPPRNRQILSGKIQMKKKVNEYESEYLATTRMAAHDAYSKTSSRKDRNNGMRSPSKNR